MARLTLEAEMLSFSRILCPVDFSEASRHAWNHAVMIGAWFNSTMLVLHVCDPLYPPEPPLLLARFPAHTGQLQDTDRRDLEHQLEPWIEEARAKGLVTSLLFDEGHNPAPPILSCAESMNADLIVMGTHGHSGFERLLLGSVTEKVLRKARCPVLTVPPAADASGGPRFEHLLCPVDFSPSSMAALDIACSIAKEANAHLTILHALDWPAEDDLGVERFASPEYRESFEGCVQARIDALVTDEVRLWADPVTLVTHGKPYRRILEIAAAEKTDLIVMGVRGRNPLDLMLFGSTTNQVVRQAACPVLTLKH
jgi:nucleotide-binding universal stress UspA family protein